MFIKNIHVSLWSINLCLENGPGKKCIWKRICQIHQIRWIKYKYKYKYMVWNLIKYKYKYKYAVFVFVFVFANTNTYLTPALTGPIAIASIQVASIANSIHRGESSVAWASPTHGGRWLAQTNYDALMTHHTTENF